MKAYRVFSKKYSGIVPLLILLEIVEITHKFNFELYYKTLPELSDIVLKVQLENLPATPSIESFTDFF